MPFGNDALKPRRNVKLILLKATPYLDQLVVECYVDVEIINLKVIIKGIKASLHKGKMSIFLPTLLITGTRVMYSPFLFKEKEDRNDFLKSVEEALLQTYPLSEWGKGPYVNKIV